jgi:hypothetical protein
MIPVCQIYRRYKSLQATTGTGSRGGCSTLLKVLQAIYKYRYLVKFPICLSDFLVMVLLVHKEKNKSEKVVLNFTDYFNGKIVYLRLSNFRLIPDKRGDRNIIQ